MQLTDHIKHYLLTVILLICCSAVFAQNWNVDLLKKINPDTPKSKYWKQISNSAYWVPPAVIFSTFSYGVLSGNGHTRGRAYETFISVGLGSLISEVLKFTVKEKRPSDQYPGEIFVNSPTTDPSFPSGHTVLAFTTATSLALEYRKWYITGPAFLWAGSVAYSRMYLGKHYPTDILAGMAIGILSGIVSHRYSVGVMNTYNMK